ncbi:MAG TPA: S8 family serine peptidase [Flavobacteriales bacterium]|mgnify:CR=1 FL=1|nr:S8 family serine peptidase [Flavobacteriales bacterium]HMR29042.1 S8 family serine peptidase [Flavobacteriales bacterium]
MRCTSAAARWQPRTTLTLFLGALLLLLAPRPVHAAQPPTVVRHKAHVALRPDPTRIAVHPDPQRYATILREGLPELGLGSGRVEPHAVHGWVVLNTGALTPEAQQDLVNTIAHMPGVTFAAAAYVDDLGGLMFPTPQVLAAFAFGIDAEGREALARQVGLTVHQEFPATGVTVLRSPQLRTGAAVIAAANALALRAELLEAEPDMVFSGRGDLVPNDPQFTSCWGLLNTGQSGGTAGIDMKASQAWDLTQGSAFIITVIIDTGVEQTHPDIMQVPGTNTTNDGSVGGGPANSFDNHGTAVAGCVSATINNSLGTVGVAPGTRSASARTMIGTTSNGNWSSQASWTVASLDWAVTIGARVTNNSNYYGFTSATIETAYTNTRNGGMVHFASAGNDASNALSYPSSLSTVNAVSSITRTGALSSFSNFNANLSFSAPGSSINSTDRTGSAGYSSGDYAVVQGTSFASPYAAGVAALVLSADPSLTAAEVEQVLQTTATDLGTTGFDIQYGHGLVNAFAAVSSVLRPLATPRLFLEGPYNSSTGLMNDALRAQGLIPATEPYTALGYAYIGGGGETVAPAVLAVTGNNAIVDWVLMELRDDADPDVVVYSRAALLQRDGDVVDVDGSSPVRLDVPADLYVVSFRHRNHLAICTSDLWNLTPVSTAWMEFTGTLFGILGTDARKSITGAFPTLALWAGDVTFNAQVKYTGGGNDRDPILTAIGGTVPTTTLNGQYRAEDVNLDAQVKYTGGNNDRDILLQNIGGTVPTAVRNAQLP